MGITVIIPSFNRVQLLKRAINSVLTQQTPAEIWVIDGGSTDGTLAVLDTYTNQNLHWISEPDKGIYQAINKGIDRASGDWIYILGSDDELAPNILQEISHFLTSNNKIVFGHVCFDNGHVMKSFLGSRTRLQNTLHHQSAFYHRSLFLDFRYDEQLKIMSDYELNLLAYLQKLPVTYVPKVIAYCQTGGTSANWYGGWQETNTIRRRYVNTFANGLHTTVLGIYYLQKQIRTWLYGHNV